MPHVCTNEAWVFRKIAKEDGRQAADSDALLAENWPQPRSWIRFRLTSLQDPSECWSWGQRSGDLIHSSDGHPSTEPQSWRIRERSGSYVWWNDELKPRRETTSWFLTQLGFSFLLLVFLFILFCISCFFNHTPFILWKLSNKNHHHQKQHIRHSDNNITSTETQQTVPQHHHRGRRPTPPAWW